MIIAPPPSDLAQVQRPATPSRPAPPLGAAFPLKALPPDDAPAESPSQPDPRVVRPPVWLRPPTVAEARALYPPAAAADGVGGQAAIFCTVEADGTLSRCSSNDPKGAYGFGEAMLSLAPSLRIRRQTIDGRPVEDGRVAIFARFDPPDGVHPVRALWTGAPIRSDVQAAVAPPLGREPNGAGRGVMLCTVTGGLLTDCRPKDRADPFDRAAVKLAPKFAIAAAFANGRPTEGAIFDIPVLFDASDATAPAPALENPVRFVRAPSNGQKNAVFPAIARARGVTRLTVTESCIAGPDGALTNCHADKEEPVGVGGAQAAARLVNAFQLSTWTSEGRPIAGAPVTVDITWDAPPAATPAEHPPAPAAQPPVPKRPVRKR